MTTTWLLLVLIASYQIVGIQSTSHDETCEDEGLLGAMATNLKSILEQQRSQLEEGEQQLRALLERIGKSYVAKDCNVHILVFFFCKFVTLCGTEAAHRSLFQVRRYGWACGDSSPPLGMTEI